MALEIEEIRSLDRWAGMSGDWKDVLSTSGEDRLFLSLTWLRSWWRIFGERRELMVLRVTEEGRSVGFAPFMITSRGKITPWRKLEFIGSGPSDRCGILASEARGDVHRAVWEHLRARDDWDIMELRDMLAGGPTDLNAHAAFPSAEYVTSMSPHVTLEDSHEKYLSKLSKNMRTNLARYWRKLESEGGSFQALRTTGEVEEAVRMLKELSDARWDIANVLKVPGMMGFVEQASRELAKEGSVVFHSLQLEGRTIAVTMGFEDPQRYMYYLSGFDPDQAKLSPGSVLLGKIIEECYQRGQKEVDLLRGTEPYKYRFNAIDRAQVHFRALNRGLLRTAGCALREAPLS